jgi:hypothetical protein
MKGKEHVVAKPGDKIVTNFLLDDSIGGEVYCTPNLPESAGNSTSLSIEQIQGALKGGL